MEIWLIGVSIFLIAYCYAIYPYLIRVLSTRFTNQWQKDTVSPSISIVLAVYNEEVVLANCLNGLLRLQYAGPVEILVGSDGSDDRTEHILDQFAREHSSIRVFPFSDRRGKIPVVNDLVAAATGDVLFFTDADVVIQPHSLQAHARHYADPVIGGVAGNLVLAADSTDLRPSMGPLGSEQYYMSIESALRTREGQLHSTVGIFGGHYSIRRELWAPLPNEPICDELYIGLHVIQSGHRMIYEAEAIAQEYFGRSMLDEYQRKRRFAARGLATLRHFPGLLNPFAGWPGFMLWSHKVLRWFTPYFLLIVLLATVTGIVAGRDQGLKMFFAFEVGVALLVLIAALVNRLNRRIPLLSHAYWFVIMNAAFAAGVLRFLFGLEQKYWSQTRRIHAPGPSADVPGTIDRKVVARIDSEVVAR